MTNDNKVGHRNPPEDKQFKKGQSGNPRAGPRAARTPERL